MKKDFAQFISDTVNKILENENVCLECRFEVATQIGSLLLDYVLGGVQNGKN